MASGIITAQSFWFHSSPKPSILSKPVVISHVSAFFSIPKCGNHLKLNHIPKASPEGLPGDLIEDSKFVPLNDENPVYGPPAILLLGFKLEEAEKFQQFLKELDGEFLEVIFCTEEMMTGSLWEAINAKQPNLETVKIAKSLPRICFFSGLTGEEMMMFIDDFPESGLESAIFAALVPNSADKPLQEVIEEIVGDHEMLSQNNQD